MEKYILKFPKSYTSLRYGGLHYQFFITYLNLLQNLQIELVDDNDRIFCDGPGFSCTLNDKQFYVDISDSDVSDWSENIPNVPYFKYQKSEKSIENSIPLAPPMCATFDGKMTKLNIHEYFIMREKFKYSPRGGILCKQRPYGNATDRRKYVKSLLVRNFPQSELDLNFQSRSSKNFWNLNSNSLVSVCVPGNRNTMVDRGQLELMGLGVCTISPKLDTIFCFNQKLIPDVHYVCCKEDYSDLVEKIKSLQNDKSISENIGKNSREFFNQYVRPDKYLKWIDNCLK